MIRNARPEDAEQVMPLIWSAIGTIAHSLAGTDDDAEANRILTSFYRVRGNRISYENVIVEERDGRVAGMALAYDGGSADRLDRPFVERIERETGRTGYTIAKEPQPNEYYLDSLAVAEPFQGQGIAKSLMGAFERKAAESGFARVSLIVEPDNERAIGLYGNMGYREDGVLQVSGKRFVRMVKPV
ncbi:GNAT family N-acetyltransferase [Paenibacillus flagellatus]|uniref:GNAT family N-acetyltransferase n=1 Tax=Paenibacillus flagellatus TaxID=2211139 RepID=A0A2V5K706_9BACL|nr:GNAT family N-acetyltransferase [Paenibacillus flagellatus]PYI55229.1 GNAT family N-acetyltransferase [Paenibacillus flagellatus]